MNAVGMTTTQATAGRQGPPAGGMPPHRVAMDAAAEKLGLEPTELRSQLDSGKTLTDLAAAAGVSTEDLKTAMATAVEASAPTAVAERVVSDLDGIIAGERPKGPPPGPRPGGGPSESSSSDAFAELLEVLAEALDTDAETLMATIEDGSFAEVLQRSGVGSSVGLVVDQAL